MEIAYFGHSCFKLKSKTSSLVTDPFDPKMVGLALPKVEAEIVTLSHDHDDHNQVGRVGGVRKVISAPGEYEIAGISIIGYPTYHDDKNGTLRGRNTIYVIEIDGKRVLHLGDLGHELSAEVLQDMGDIDVLMVPVGGKYTIGPKEAVELVNAIEPRVIVPMHYGGAGLAQDFADLHSAQDFVDEIGIKSEQLPKIKDENIPAEDQLVVILEKK